MASECYALHASVFHGDIKRVAQLIRSHDISQKDVHGNTPLHLAVMLGQTDCMHKLLANNAPINLKNSLGWTPLAEAISYGDRDTVFCLLRKLKLQSRAMLAERRPVLLSSLKSMDDFYMEIRWDISCWVPLVARMLPSDVCKIYKKGTCIRLDTTLLDFSDMHWERGDISFLFDGSKPVDESLTILDNKSRIYKRLRFEVSHKDLADEVNCLMRCDNMSMQMSTKNITFSRAQSGWLFREDKTERVGEFKADFYFVNGLNLESKKRREHLTPEEVRKNKVIMENLNKGSIEQNEENSAAMVYEAYTRQRCSMSPPRKPSMTWEEYIQAPPGNPPCLGKKMIVKENTKTFKATLAMSDDFAMTIEMLLDVLEVVAPFKQFKKLRDLMMTRLPPGFPVRIEVPLFPSITARVTFLTYEQRNNLEPRLFSIPDNFHEDVHRFPDL